MTLTESCRQSQISRISLCEWLGQRSEDLTWGKGRFGWLQKTHHRTQAPEFGQQRAVQSTSQKESGLEASRNRRRAPRRGCNFLSAIKDQKSTASARCRLWWPLSITSPLVWPFRLPCGYSWPYSFGVGMGRNETNLSGFSKECLSLAFFWGGGEICGERRGKV